VDVPEFERPVLEGLLKAVIDTDEIVMLVVVLVK
jgi:hypothetical protein